MKKKLFLFLLLLAGLQAFAAPAGQKGITLDKKGATVSEILDAVEAQTGFIFVTSGTDLTMTRSLSVRNASLDEVLRAVFTGTDITWTVSGVNVYLSKGSAAKPGATDGPGTARTVTGRVVDSDGAPLPGASILVDGTSNGVMAGPDGRFTLSGVPFPARVTVSFIGLTDKKMTLSGGE